MAHNESYMPIFESFNTIIAGHDESAEDSDAATSLAASAGPAKARTNGKATLNEFDDKRKRASGKGKRKIAIGTLLLLLYNQSVVDHLYYKRL